MMVQDHALFSIISLDSTVAVESNDICHDFKGFDWLMRGDSLLNRNPKVVVTPQDAVQVGVVKDLADGRTFDLEVLAGEVVPQGFQVNAKEGQVLRDQHNGLDAVPGGEVLHPGFWGKTEPPGESFFD